MSRGTGLAAEPRDVRPGASPPGTSLNKLAISEDMIKIVTQGRISKLPHIVRLRFVLGDGSFFVLAGERRSDWVVNALRAGNAKVRLGNLVIRTVVSEATVGERTSTLGGFATKYGSRVVRDWYSNAMALRLTPEGPPIQRAALKGEGEPTATYEDWRSQNKEYYRSVSEAFDSASEEYDFTISHNYINTWIRERSVSELLRLVNSGDTLVEIGCGTGAETLDIARHVSRIVATDISDKMIEILKKKIQARKAFNNVIPLRLRAADISKVRDSLEGSKAQAAYSFNGALNCEPDLEGFVEGLASVLTPGGYFACSVRNSLCIGEALAHAAVLQFEKMAPRKRRVVMVSVGGIDIPAFYYSPSAFTEFFRQKFKLRRTIGLPALMPPAYLSDYYVRYKKIASLLEKFEFALGDRFPFNRLGDQTLFIFQNR
jgi:ubiquinone/menaquinone biosynthesis C-methylase UbiE